MCLDEAKLLKFLKKSLVHLSPYDIQRACIIWSTHLALSASSDCNISATIKSTSWKGELTGLDSSAI